MHIATLTVGFMLALGVAGILTKWIRDLAHQNQWVDQPDGTRKLHAAATPTMGGLAMAAGFLVGFGFLFYAGERLSIAFALPPWGLWAGAALMLGVGAYDDIHGVGFKAKFLLQIIAAYVLLASGYRIDGSMLGLDVTSFHEALITIPLTILWVVGVINAVNLLDGLDGLAAGVVMIAFAALAGLFALHGSPGLAVIAVAMAGAISGFLIYNFNPASIFMGDSGSLFLGYMIAAYALQGLGSLQGDPFLVLFTPVIALALPLTDTGLAFLRRLLSAKAVFAPDCDHIHHRLLRSFTERTTVLLLYGIALWCGLAAIVMTTVPAIIGYAALATTIVAMFAGLRMLGYLRIVATFRLWRRWTRTEASPQDENETVPPEATAKDPYAGDGAGEDLIVDHQFSSLESS